jgi:hypothetical protein
LDVELEKIKIANKIESCLSHENDSDLRKALEELKSELQAKKGKIEICDVKNEDTGEKYKILFERLENEFQDYAASYFKDELAKEGYFEPKVPETSILNAKSNPVQASVENQI